MKVRILSFLFGLGAAVVFWIVMSGDDDVAPRSAEPEIVVREVDRAIGPAGGGGASSEDDPPDERVESTERESAGETGDVVGTLVVQADEIDQCLDVRGSWLVLENRSAGTTHRAVILENGGALFEEIRFRPGRTLFGLRTEIADRACFPEVFPIEREDISGSPPSAAVSVAIIHRHGLAGAVFDAKTRRPIEGATVAVDSFELIGTVTDAAGRYALELPDPRGTLVITAPGYQEILWRFPEETDGGTWLPDRRDFELLPDRLTAWLDVTATREDGTPAAGAEIEVVTLHRFAPPTEALEGMSAAERRRFLENLKADIEAFGPAAGAREELVSPLDAEGRATLRIHVPGRYRVDVRADDEIGRAEVEVTAGERREVPILVGPAATLVVRTSCDGEPVRAPVRFRPASGGDAIVARTNESGETTFRSMVPGTTGTVGVPDGVNTFRGSPASVVLAGPGSETVVMLDLERRTAVRGEVVDARTGRPIAGARVDWVDTEGTIDPSASRISDASGRYESNAPPGGTLRAVAGEYRTAEVARAGDASAVPPLRLTPIELDPFDGTTRLFLRAVDSAGAPVPRAQVRVTSTILTSDGHEEPRFDHVYGGHSLEDGRILPTLGWPLTPGERVRIVVFAKASGLLGLVHVDVTVGDERTVDVVLLRATTIEGTVTLDGGMLPVGGVVLSWLSAGGATSSATSRDDGTFVLVDAAAGPGVLSARMPFRGADLELDVPESGLTDVILRLEPRDDL